MIQLVQQIRRWLGAELATGNWPGLYGCQSVQYSDWKIWLKCHKIISWGPIDDM